MIVNLSEQASLASKFVKELRDINIQQDRLRFRTNLNRLGQVLAYEISKTLSYETCQVQTPLATANEKNCTDNIVLATLLRAGLPFHQGFLDYFDNAGNAFISAYRKHDSKGDFDIKLEYISCPDLSDSVLIIVDPMLATGASMDRTITALEEYGKPKALYLVTAIASRTGLDFIKDKHPNAHIYMGALDEELTAKAYISPGLGDAGDLAFGVKLQE